MLFALFTLLASLLCVTANNSTNKNNHCQPVPAGTNAIGAYLLLGNRYVYTQHRFGPPIIAEKCWSTGFFLSDANLLDYTLNPIWRFYEPRRKHRDVRVKLFVLGNVTKWYFIWGGREIIATNIVLTPDYVVSYFCRGTEHSIVIATTRRHRDEKIIQRAIEDTKKIVGSLPSPSVNMDCDELLV